MMLHDSGGTGSITCGLLFLTANDSQYHAAEQRKKRQRTLGRKCKRYHDVGSWRMFVSRRISACALRNHRSVGLISRIALKLTTSAELACHWCAARCAGHVVHIIVRVLLVVVLLAGSGLWFSGESAAAPPPVVHSLENS